jgi:hypothetical protein
MGGPVISIERSKQTGVRGSAPPHPTAPRTVRVPYLSYGLSSKLWVIRFYSTIIHGVYPNPRISKEVMFVACLNYAFGNVILDLFKLCPL